MENKELLQYPYLKEEKGRLYYKSNNYKAKVSEKQYEDFIKKKLLDKAIKIPSEQKQRFFDIAKKEYPDLNNDYLKGIFRLSRWRLPRNMKY